MSTLLRAIPVVCVFAMVGPLVGGAVAWLTMGARSLRSPLPFITGAYGEGIWPALGTGAVCCAAALSLRTTRWLVPIGAALAVTVIGIAVGAALDPPRADLLASLTRIAVVFLPPSIIAAVVCWAISRRLLPRGM